MKTITKLGQFLRLSDAEAEAKVKNNGWSYCPKEEYKKVTKFISEKKEEKKTKKT